MVKLLTEAEVDSAQEQVDAELDAAGADAPLPRRLSPTDKFPDLTDGGMVGDARLHPTRGHAKQAKGRPAARRAWMWNGTETVLPLAWNPDGTMHDGARRYLLKRVCLCCHTGGFRGRQCPNCVKSGCDRCGGSTDRTKIIANFYLRKEDVPFPVHFFGNINCFLGFCPRRDGRGFLTEQDMRVHAMTRHRLEYQAHLQSVAAARTDELEALRRRVDELSSQQDKKRRDEERMAKARAARKRKTVNGA